MALQLLESSGGANRRYGMVDDSYGYLHFISNDENGELILRILCDADIWESTESMLKSDLAPSPFSVCDAMDHDGPLILFSYVMDLKRVKGFTAWIAMHRQKGRVICFDFQQDILQKFCGENICLKSLDVEKYRRSFFDK